MGEILIISSIAWCAVIVGALVVTGGGLRPSTVLHRLVGCAIVAYGLCLNNSAPMFASTPQPLTTDERIWGVTWTVLGGWALLSVFMHIHGADRTGTRTWRGKPINPYLVIFGIAVVSLLLARAGLQLTPDLAPSTDFLNDYGSRPGVIVYQLVFAVWVAAPASLLGFYTWRYRRGPARWIMSAGCLAGVWFGVWKVAGIAVRAVTGHKIPAASPVSTYAAAATVGLLAMGLVAGLIQTRYQRNKQERAYALARSSDDDSHYAQGPDPAPAG